MVSKEFARSISTETENIPQYPIHRLTVEQYHGMIEAGILTPEDHVELLEGWLVEKMGKKPQHTLANQLAAEILAKLVPSGWFVNTQEPITLADSEPEPDVTIIRGVRRDYLTSHPTVAQIGLVVEVTDATLQHDRTLKLRIYAAAGIPCYWLLNLIDRQLEVYTQPIGEGKTATYTQRTDYAPDAEVPVMLDGAEIARIRVADLLS